MPGTSVVGFHVKMSVFCLCSVSYADLSVNTHDMAKFCAIQLAMRTVVVGVGCDVEVLWRSLTTLFESSLVTSF
jgi:hypothetical protein